MQKLAVWSTELRACSETFPQAIANSEKVLFFSFQVSFNFYSLKKPKQFLLEFKYRKELPAFSKGEPPPLSLLPNTLLAHLSEERFLQNSRI